jgi:arginyl-tRNA synthetase
MPVEPPPFVINCLPLYYFIYNYASYTEKEEVNHMNKIDVITALAEKKNLTGKKATEIVNLIFKGFTNELKNVGVDFDKLTSMVSSE